MPVRIESKRLFLLLTVAIITTMVFIILNEEDCSNTGAYLPQNQPLDSKRGQIACQFPQMDPFSPSAMKYYEQFPTVTCSGVLPTITYYDGDIVRINQTLKLRHHGQRLLTCWYRSVTYKTRVDYVTGPWRGPFSDSIPVQDKPPFVEVNCRNEKDEIVSQMHHYIQREEKRTKEIPVKHKFQEEEMNVLMVGLDSLSHHLFVRAMPKTRAYLLNIMEAVELNVYNKVGHNTFPNLLALLTGKYENEISGWTRAQGFDPVPFIWKMFKAAGYATQYVSDRTDFDDFWQPPTDSYNHPMVTSLMMNKVAFNNNCFEDEIEVKLWLNLVREFAWDSLNRTGRFFSLAMIKRPTHDFPNQASAVDEHYARFIKNIHESNLMNNTFFIFFGDHGPMKGSYRETYEGSLEERAANMVVYLPLWFREKYSRLYANLLTNANRLTTNFDIHHTLKCILNRDYEGKTTKDEHQRGLSLLSEISTGRTCKDAGISLHYCMCDGGVSVAWDHMNLIPYIGQHVVQEINALTVKQIDQCAVLSLANVTSLSLLTGSFARSAVYRIMLITEPGRGTFEATVDYSVNLYFFTSVKTVGMISRISAYRGLSDCVEHDTFLRMYCYCNNLIEKD